MGIGPGNGVIQDRARILVVEDDQDIGGETVAELRKSGLEVVWCDTAEAALRELELGRFQLLLIDRMLPGMDGLSLVRKLRAANQRAAVIIISALGELGDRVSGLETGGDDYLAKPFALAELKARVQAQLRRPYDGPDTVLSLGPLTVDLVERCVWRDGVPVELLPREFNLLVYFMRRPNQLVTRDMLLRDVWHYKFLPQTNLIDVHLGKLRRKIDQDPRRSLIQSVRGAGFVFAAPGPTAQPGP